MTDFQYRLINKSELPMIYSHMLADFPDNERKPLPMIEESFDTGFMEGYGLYSEQDELMAYSLFVKKNNYLLLDYFAVVKAYRNEGIGSEFLRCLIDRLQNYDRVFLEVEDSDCAMDPKEKEMMLRRLAFYERNNVCDTGVRGTVYGVPYRFLEFGPSSSRSFEETISEISLFYRSYWPKEVDFQKYVQFQS